MMLHLAWPWMLIFFPLPWIIHRYLPPVSPKGNALFLPFALNIEEFNATGTLAYSSWRKRLFTLLWIVLVIASARPQWQDQAQPVPTAGRRLLLALDVSGSMAAEDMEGNLTRLQVVQKVAGDFIKNRQGDRIGLILFGTRPYLQAPLTMDLQTVEQFLYETMIGIAGNETAIGDAIGLSLKRLKEDRLRDPAQKDTVLILLTDGASNSGVMPPIEAAKLAAANHIRIYTIGVGAAPEEGFLGLTTGNTDLDEKTLQDIARITGARYFRATDTEALKQVYTLIDQLEPSAGEKQWYRPTKEWFPWPLGTALVLSIILVVLPSTYKRLS